MSKISQHDREILYQCMRETNPSLYDKIMKQHSEARIMIGQCIDIAMHSNNEKWKSEVNNVFVSKLVNDTEKILLNYICIIKHQEHINNGIKKEDEVIQKCLTHLIKYRDLANSSRLTNTANDYLDYEARKLIIQYRIRPGVGRPKGKGKYIYTYNGKEYHTIQECANDYHITKQAMHKKLKKLHII